MKRIIICIVLILSLMLLVSCNSIDTKNLNESKALSEETTVKPDEQEVKDNLKKYFEDLNARSSGMENFVTNAMIIDLNKDGIIEVVYQTIEGNPQIAYYMNGEIESVLIESEAFFFRDSYKFMIDENTGDIVVRCDGNTKDSYNYHVSEILRFTGKEIESVDKLQNSSASNFEIDTEEGFAAAQKASLDAFNNMYSEFVKNYSLTEFSDISVPLDQLFK